MRNRGQENSEKYSNKIGQEGERRMTVVLKTDGKGRVKDEPVKITWKDYKQSRKSGEKQEESCGGKREKDERRSAEEWHGKRKEGGEMLKKVQKGP